MFNLALMLCAAWAFLQVAYATPVVKSAANSSQDQTQTVVVAIAGLTTDFVALADVDVISNGKHTKKGSAAPASRHGFASAIQNSTVYIIGGFEGNEDATNLWIYDIVSNQWQTDLPAPPVAFSGHSAVQSNGIIYVLGGWIGQDSTAQVHTYDIKQRKWSVLKTTNPEISFAACLLEQQNSLFYLPGGQETNFFRSVDGGDSWKQLASPVAGRENMACAALGTDAIIVTGGIDSGAMDFVQIYNITTNKWTSTAAPMLTARGDHSATLMPNGKDVLVCGGHIAHSVGHQDNVLDSCEIYDSEADEWKDAGFSLDQARFGFGLYAVQV